MCNEREKNRAYVITLEISREVKNCEEQPKQLLGKALDGSSMEGAKDIP